MVPARKLCVITIAARPTGSPSDAATSICKVVQNERADERARTADLLITKLIPLIPARIALSGNCVDLEVFLEMLSDGLLVVSLLVLAGSR